MELSKMGFKDELKNFEKTVLELQNTAEREVIPEEDVVKSLVILNYISYEKVPDAFLGCAALNLLNTYVKQKDSKLGYRFRRHLYNLLKGIDDINQIKTINVFYDISKSNGMLMIVFWGFQFSFHGEKNTEMIKKLQKKRDMEWDGIKKQLCAKTIFEFALSTSWISNKTQNNSDLRELVISEIADYRNGSYVFSNGELIKILNVEYGKQIEDKYLKNYVREELKKCQGRPVILTGKFKKIWEKHVTFTTIRPYIQGCHTLTICDHINILRKDIEQVMNISELKKNKKYYLIGFCEQYKYKERMGVKLAVGYEFCPLLKASDFEKAPPEVFSICYRFSIEKFLRLNQKHLMM